MSRDQLTKMRSIRNQCSVASTPKSKSPAENAPPQIHLEIRTPGQDAGIRLLRCRNADRLVKGGREPEDGRCVLLCGGWVNLGRIVQPEPILVRLPGHVYASLFCCANHSCIKAFLRVAARVRSVARLLFGPEPP